jgi:hypothetical protein
MKAKENAMDATTQELLTRIAEALERLSPSKPHIDITDSDAYIWDGETRHLAPVAHAAGMPLSLLIGIDEARDMLLANTRQFAKGYSANNALLWGARGMGKSSLIKAVHAAICKELPHAVALVEIRREDIGQLPVLMHCLRDMKRRFVVFCDDLSFDGGEAAHKNLKTTLEGGIEGRPENIVFYATSNRRHLMEREAKENERHDRLHSNETGEEKISVSDRFGLWLGFHSCSRETYFTIIETYAKHYGLSIAKPDLLQQASLWANARGSRSGRVAWQFIIDLAGKLEKSIAA